MRVEVDTARRVEGHPGHCSGIMETADLIAGRAGRRNRGGVRGGYYCACCRAWAESRSRSRLDSQALGSMIRSRLELQALGSDIRPGLDLPPLGSVKRRRRLLFTRRFPGFDGRGGQRLGEAVQDATKAGEASDGDELESTAG